jgi:hypothetical protein
MSLGPWESDPNDYTILGTYAVDSENLYAKGSHFLHFYAVASVKVRSTV